MKTSEEKKITVTSEGFVVKIREAEMEKNIFNKVFFSLEIICGIPILIFQFPAPYNIVMLPVELTGMQQFSDTSHLKVRLELTCNFTKMVKELVLSEDHSNRIKQCRKELPQHITKRKARAVEDYSFFE